MGRLPLEVIESDTKQAVETIDRILEALARLDDVA